MSNSAQSNRIAELLVRDPTGIYRPATGEEVLKSAIHVLYRFETIEQIALEWRDYDRKRAIVRVQRARAWVEDKHVTKTYHARNIELA
jgi:hypothetical protein